MLVSERIAKIKSNAKSCKIMILIPALHVAALVLFNHIQNAVYVIKSILWMENRSAINVHCLLNKLPSAVNAKKTITDDKQYCIECTYYDMTRNCRDQIISK